MKLCHAWPLLLALAACGDDGGGGPSDAPPEVPDATVQPDADPSGPVTITVTSEGNPIPGIDVLFSDPAGAEISQQVTDASGQATEVVLPGSAATIAVMVPGDPGGTFAAITWLGVEPGDDLVWQFDAPVPVVVGDWTVTLPGDHAGASTYQVQLGCTSLETATPATPVGGQLTSDCLGSDQSIDVVAFALDAADAPIAYSFAKDVAAVDGGTTSVTLGAWQTAFDPLTVTLSGAPAAAPTAGLDVRFRVDEAPFIGPGSGAAFTAGTATLTSAYPQGFAERVQYSTFVQLGPDPEDGLAAILVGHPGTPATASHDLSTLLLPAIGSATAANGSGQLELGWTASGSFATADGALAMSQWIEGADSHLWFVLAPPDVSNPFRLPVLPDELAGFRPSATSVFDAPSLFFFEGDFIDGYAGFRQVGFQIVGQGAESMLPAAGGVLRVSVGGKLPV